MHFHRDLTDAQLGGDLLVELAADGQLKHLMLARREGHVALLQGVVLFDAGGVVLCQSERGFDGADERAGFNGLSEKFVGSAFDRPDGHRDGAVTGEKDDRYFPPAGFQRICDIKSGYRGHLHIEDHAGGQILKGMAEKGFC